LRKWGALRSLHITSDAVGYRDETLGHALATGTLRHLVTLDVWPSQNFDHCLLDSNVYRWCTPLLENLTVKLGRQKPTRWRTLEGYKFFVNLPKLRRLYMFFADELTDLSIVEDVPQTVAELKLECYEPAKSLPNILHVGLEMVSLDGFSVDNVVTPTLNLNYRCGSSGLFYPRSKLRKGVPFLYTERRSRLNSFNSLKEKPV
jgi:hypothetical protein